MDHFHARLPERILDSSDLGQGGVYGLPSGLQQLLPAGRLGDPPHPSVAVGVQILQVDGEQSRLAGFDGGIFPTREQIVERVMKPCLTDLLKDFGRRTDKPAPIL